jgi:peroxiredoxin
MFDTKTPIGWKAKDFALKGTDGKTYSLSHVRGPKGTLVVFICNHCPYVKASIDRIVTEAKALREIGIGTIAVMPNDTDAYPEDSFEKDEEVCRTTRLQIPLRDRFHPRSSAGLRCPMHPRFLRIQRPGRIAIPWPVGRS